MMEARRKSLGDVPGTATLPNLASILERSPLLDCRQLRRWSSSTTLDSKSVSVFHLQPQRQKPMISRTTKPAHNLSGMSMKIQKTIAAQQPPLQPSVRSLPRSRSASFHRGSPGGGQYTSSPAQVPPRSSDHAQFRSSPQYRVNPAVVRFDERLLPERMNYGIAGYNTSRPRSSTAESSRRGVVIRTRPRSVHILPLWTRRLRVRMIRVRVKSACSRLIKRFQRRRRQE